MTVGNHRKPWWLCPKGHEWRASISSRVRGGAGCPHCAAGWRRSKPEVSIQCELEAVLDVDVLGDEPLNTEHGTFRIDMIIPSFKVAVEYDGSRWHTTGVQRDALKAKAVEAAGWTLIRVRETPLELTRPDDLAIATVVADYHPITAQVLQRMFLRLGERSGAEPEAVVVPELAARVDWYLQGGRCVATAKAEQLAEDGLAGRSARRPSSGTPRPKPGGSLAEKSPAIAVEWHPTLNGELTAFDVANARNASAWWLCATCGAEWQATINGRVRGQRVNCPTCNRAKAGAARSRPRPGESLADLHPHLAVQWDLERNGALTPADVKSRSHNRVWWKCSTCGDLRLASVDARVAAARVACAACGVTPDTGSPA